MNAELLVLWRKVAVLRRTNPRPRPVAELDELALHTPVAQVGLPAAMRITSLRIAAAVDGRPGRRRLA